MHIIARDCNQTGLITQWLELVTLYDLRPISTRDRRTLRWNAFFVCAGIIWLKLLENPYKILITTCQAGCALGAVLSQYQWIFFRRCWRVEKIPYELLFCYLSDDDDDLASSSFPLALMTYVRLVLGTFFAFLEGKCFNLRNTWWYKLLSEELPQNYLQKRAQGWPSVVNTSFELVKRTELDWFKRREGRVWSDTVAPSRMNLTEGEMHVEMTGFKTVVPLGHNRNKISFTFAPIQTFGRNLTGCMIHLFLCRSIGFIYQQRSESGWLLRKQASGDLEVTSVVRKWPHPYWRIDSCPYLAWHSRLTSAWELVKALHCSGLWLCARASTPKSVRDAQLRLAFVRSPLPYIS